MLKRIARWILRDEIARELRDKVAFAAKVGEWNRDFTSLRLMYMDTLDLKPGDNWTCPFTEQMFRFVKNSAGRTFHQPLEDNRTLEPF